MFENYFCLEKNLEKNYLMRKPEEIIIIIPIHVKKKLN